MITLEERRKEAIEADKCFSKSTLKDEYRMKPSPTAQPAKYFKNGYGSEFGVYRIADCVPMREKRPATEKQILAGKQLAARSRRGRLRKGISKYAKPIAVVVTV